MPSAAKSPAPASAPAMRAVSMVVRDTLIALTNASQNTSIKFHVDSEAGDATSCHVAVCNSANEIHTTNFEAVTGGLGLVGCYNQPMNPAVYSP